MSTPGYHLELERVRLRAMLAIERIGARAEVAGARERMTQELARVEAALGDHRPAGRAAALAERLGLIEDEVDLLWTAVAVAADPRVQPHARVLGGGEARRGISLATHALIADLDGNHARLLARRLLAPNPLFADGILAWDDDHDAPAARTIVAPPRTIGWLAGIEQPDPALGGAARVVKVPAAPQLDARQHEALIRIEGLLAGAPLIILEGAPGSGRATAVAQVAGERAVVALELRRLPRRAAVLEAALDGLRRECRLRDAIPVLADAEELLGDDGPALARTVARAIDLWDGPFVVTTALAGIEIPAARTLVRMRWPVPDVATRRALWVRATAGGDAPPLPPETLDGLAMRYRLGAGGIARAVATSRICAGARPLTPTDLTDGVRANIAERLGELAVRTDVTQGWGDLVLAPDLLDQVRALVARVRHAHTVLEGWGFASKVARGGGVAALFSGPPGTGKTMVAGLIARELDLELYQVDLSKVVSKWVGETEKQLARVFEAAEAGHALLLFDEADALFARRTEVKSAVDRYANLEVNYLLQRIESFGGITILTTNLDTSIDPALKRRLAAHVVFWPPDTDERAQLWRGFLPAAAPFEGTLDADALAEQFPEMTGANIRNAVVAAAFLAAGEGRPMSQQHLERAGRGEYVAMGRVISARRS